MCPFYTEICFVHMCSANKEKENTFSGQHVKLNV